jgi:hypothetical protein
MEEAGMNRCRSWQVAASVLLVSIVFATGAIGAEEVEIGGVTFAPEKAVAGKTLTLNGVALRKAMGFIKVFVGGLYLETPTNDAETVITSKQVKHLYLHYLTSKATAEKLQHGFIEAFKKANPPEMVAAQAENIALFASWLDEDMFDGAISETTYIPGQGLTLRVNGNEKGTITDAQFIEMYYRYQVGEGANKNLRQGYLGQ